MPHWNAAMLFSLMIVLYLIVIVAPLELTSHLNSVVDLRIGVLILYGALIILNYILFIRNGRYKEVAEAFNQLDKSSQRKKYVNGILISVSGYLLPILLIILMAKVL